MISQKIYLFLSLLSMFLFARQAQLVQHFPWGKDKASLQKREAPEALYGPQSFSVQNDTLRILDTQNRQLKTFINGRWKKSLPVPFDSRDFIWQKNGMGICLSGNTVFQTDGNGWREVYHGPLKQTIRRLQKTDEGFVVNYSAGMNLEMGTPALKKGAAKESGVLYDGYKVRLIKEDRATGRVDVENLINGRRSNFIIDVPRHNLASLQCIGVDKQRHIFLQVELIENEIPLRVARTVQVFDLNGKRLARLDLSPFVYAFIENDIRIDHSGNFYQMLASADGVDIYKWPIDSLLQAGAISYPQKYSRSYHYNRHILGDTDAPQSGLAKTTGALPMVTPDEALAMADRYVRLSWQCADANLTHGRIQDPNGAEVETPDWLQVGVNTKMPYRWGGFETIQQFLDGIQAGRYAGDKATSAVSAYARGVDCSGFVSRTWKLPVHYSTRMMDDEITQPYDSWDKLKPGDAVHKPGHVRLVIANNPNGTVEVAEASGKDWRVSYRSYDYSQFTSYTPRYYINMLGSPLYVPQPTLYAASCVPDALLQWKDVTAGLSAFRVLRSGDGAVWQPDTLLAPGQINWRDSLVNGAAAYYKMIGIAASDSVTQSPPSDTYGAYRRDGQPQVLIVDGFDRFAGSGSWQEPYHAFAVSYGQALHELGIPFETAANEAIIDRKIALDDYRMVIWFLGDESTADQTFDGDEQRLVAAYLKNGGNLWVTGSEVAWDLDHKGAASDQSFFHSFLKAVYKQDDSKSYTVNGAANTSFSGLSLHYDDGSHGVYPEDYPDVIAPVNNSRIALRYANGFTAAVSFKGVFPGGVKEGRLFYMGFPFETIYDSAERLQLMAAVSDFFEMDVTGLATGAQQKQPRHFKLAGAYPNPFNPITRIRFSLPAAGNVRLSVYNSAGQRVFKQMENFDAGQREIQFVAGNLASGVYLYMLTFKGMVRRGRFILLK